MENGYNETVTGYDVIHQNLNKHLLVSIYYSDGKQ